MSGFLRLLLGTAMAMFGWLASPAITVSASADFDDATYAYDAPIYEDPGSDAASERGPPPEVRRYNTYDAAGRWSHGAAARRDATAPAADFAFGHARLLVQVAVPTPTMPRTAQLVPAHHLPVDRLGVAANTGMKALPSGPKITAQWGADTYRHGGLMSTIEHINDRHAYSSGFPGVNRFAQGTTARGIRGHVDYVLRNGTVTNRGTVGDVGRAIGYDRAGNHVSGLEIVVRDGMIKTAYPVGVP